ncbi:serine hydrolase domain-containing protein [Flaviaesturariibacter aridisoli]|uniref:Class C beta-lactamase-related serine hydrolase n=1 Tax=Flaviaesturariibacter aridisoli TaxID=2545761 RepID=A0A4R4DTE7_9BACT|nr:serine hydrolase [Flaviaesturariibacter aridisoli]TCZ65201.1 class C beta-lactamase-related serine hydrolase [Flaviaesturariibacter aridisoli]
MSTTVSRKPSLARRLLRVAGILLLLGLAYGVYYAWRAFPIISGYFAKNMASAVFVQGRDPETVRSEDLGGFPFSLASYEVNRADSSVTVTVWGLARHKAIYRAGLGCTLLNKLPEADVRAQRFVLPPRPLSSDTLPWPMGDLRADSFPVAIDPEKLSLAMDHALMARSSEGDGPGRTRSFLVLYDGQLVGERYAEGVDKNLVQIGWSMSKSMTAALIGILVKEGRLNPDAPAPVPEWKGTDKAAIRLRDLLQQSSGLDFEEDYGNPSEVTNMLFRSDDMAAFTAARPLAQQPGTVFNYSSGNSNILSRIIRRTVGEERYAAFPYEALFYRIGAYSTLLEPDASGTYIGSSYSYATARDFARFGLLYYQDGVWNGTRLLPEGWVAASVQPAPGDPNKRYGYQFWLNGQDPEHPGQRKFPDAPADLYYSKGFNGQGVYIIPSKKVIVVRLGQHPIDENTFLREVLAALRP